MVTEMDLEQRLSRPLGDGGGGRNNNKEAAGGMERAPRQRGRVRDKPYESKSKPTTSSELTNRLYVGSLDYSVSWQDLKDHFKQAGNVVYANVMLDDNGRSKGCGIVEYETTEEARAALAMLNHSVIGDSKFKIFVREDRDDRARSDKGQKGRAARVDNKPSGGGARGRRAGAKDGGDLESASTGGSGVVITTRRYEISHLLVFDSFAVCSQTAVIASRRLMRLAVRVPPTNFLGDRSLSATSRSRRRGSS